MQRHEAQVFFDTEIMGHYPDWTPTSTKINTCVTAIQRFPKEVALAGLRQYYLTPKGGFKAPVFGKIIEICNVQQQKAAVDNGPKTDNEPVLLFTLKCVGQPVWGGRVGSTNGFFAATPKQVPGDKTKIQRAAEKMVEKFVKFYGGAWEIIRDWDAEELPF